MSAAHLPSADRLLAWASDRASEGELPWFIRNLILLEVGANARIEFDTGRGVSNSSFDGIVDTGAHSARVPSGFSVWEISTRNNVKAKAEEDFKKRSYGESELNRKEVTYVGVSLRRFPNRQQWQQQKREEAIWKDVRFLDVEDLSLWLDQHTVLAYRMAYKFGLASTLVLGLEEWWESWSTQCTPPIANDWMLSGRSETVSKIQADVQKVKRSLILCESTQLDCLALLYSSIRSMEDEVAESLLARTLYVPTVEAFIQVNSMVRNAILVPMCDLDDRHVAHQSNMVVYCGHPISSIGAIRVKPIDAYALAELIRRDCNDHELAWRAAKVARSSISLLRKELGAPPTPFDLSKVSVTDLGLLQTMLLAGRWTTSAGDLSVLQQISQVTQDRIASLSSSLMQSDPPFLRSVAGVTFVTDQGLAFEQMAHRFSGEILEAFKGKVPIVLGDPDPSFDLPVEKRWMAGVLAERPIFSGHLKSGFSQSLAIIAEHDTTTGKYSRGEEFADEVVRTVLMKATARTWYSMAGILSLLAEASPKQFLAAVNADLAVDDPQNVQGLFFRLDDALAGGSRHSSMLWALEALAWSSDYLHDAAFTLCRLHERGFGSGTGNNPMSSLREIFLPWSPSTNASVDERLAVLDALRRRYPHTAWELQSLLLPKHHSVGHPTNRPRHRAIAERPRVLNRDVVRFNQELLDRVLIDAGSDSSRLSEIAVTFAGYPDEYLDRALNRLRAANQELTDSAERTAIWDAMRECWINHSRFVHAEWSMKDGQSDRYKEVLDLFEPSDTVPKHAWLFKQWGHLPVPWPDVDVDDEEQIRLQKQSDAVSEIFAAKGTIGIFELAQQAPEPATVGRAFADAQLLTNELELSFLKQTLGDPLAWKSNLGSGFVLRRAFQSGDELLLQLLSTQPPEGLVGKQRSIVYLCSDVGNSLWPIIASEGREVQDYYWDHFRGWISESWSEADVELWITRLVERNRVIRLVDLLCLSRHVKHIDKLDEYIVSALEALASSKDVTIEELSSLSWQVSALLDKVCANPNANIQKLASLEFIFYKLINRHHKPVSLMRLVAQEPTVYCDLLKLVYRADNPSEDSIADEPWARTAHELIGSWGFEEWSLIDAVSVEELSTWIEAVVSWGKANGFTKATGLGIGTILARTSQGSDGVWPAAPVSALIERYTELYGLQETIRVTRSNLRGVTTRMPGEGGALERTEAEQYRTWAAARTSYPTVREILLSLASDLERQARREDESDGLRQDLG